MWSEKFMARYGIWGYNVLPSGDMENLEDDADETKDKAVKDKLNMLNQIAKKNEYCPNKTRSVSRSLKKQNKNKNRDMKEKLG